MTHPRFDEIRAAAIAVLGTPDDDIDDDLRTHTAPFLFALRDKEWVTVTRADLAPAGIHGADPISTVEGAILAAIAQEIIDLPRGESTTLRVYRDLNGVLTWNVTAP